MAELTPDHPKARTHREVDGPYTRQWTCVPLNDANAHADYLAQRAAAQLVYIRQNVKSLPDPVPVAQVVALIDRSLRLLKQEDPPRPEG